VIRGDVFGPRHHLGLGKEASVSKIDIDAEVVFFREAAPGCACKRHGNGVPDDPLSDAALIKTRNHYRQSQLYVTCPHAN
jgi:hypothetical protein